MDRFGIRPVVATALGLIAAGSALPIFATRSWHLMFTWGLLVGLGTGCMALVLGATIASRWFLQRRGLVMGSLTAGGFAICGATTNGLIGTHFVPAAHDHGMHETTAAGLLAVVGIFDLVGTIASGRLTDRFDPRRLRNLPGTSGLRWRVVACWGP